MRTKPPDRRNAVTLTVSFMNRSYPVTYGLVGDKPWEAFCSVVENIPDGSELHATVSDACIALSVLRQEGYTWEKLTQLFQQNWPEGSTEGHPASIIGAVARAGLELERTLVLELADPPRVDN
jgi:hypothetical protein